MTKEKSPNLLHGLARTLETKPKFKLNEEERRRLSETLRLLGLTLEAWSFVVHPKVIASLFPGDQAPRRYIFVIETLRADLYWAVREFLASWRTNVNSYYTGGSADFLCDATLTAKTYRSFTDGLRQALVSGGANRLVQDAIRKYVSEFRVEESIVLCHHVLKELGEPGDDDIAGLLKDRVTFEEALRDYSSKRFVRRIGDGKRAENYITSLGTKRVLVGYRPVLDYSLYLDREYVPIAKINTETLLHLVKKDRAILEPAMELLRVFPTEPADEVDKDVTHMFINNYTHPGQRQAWKQTIYRAGPAEVNTFSFPLEGTLNESTVVLSNMPDLVAEASRYSSQGGVGVGNLLSPDGVPGVVSVELPISGLGFHGVTLGEPGTGKTNSDMVIALGLASRLECVVVIDATGGVRSKISGDAHVAGTTPKFLPVADAPGVNAAVSAALEGNGLIVIEPTQEFLGPTWSAIAGAVVACADRVKHNGRRRIARFLLLEEAFDLLAGGGRGRTVLLALLNKAARKGWSIWVSTQLPSHLGSDQGEAVAALALLKNRLIHRMGQRPEVGILNLVSAQEGVAAWGDCEPGLGSLAPGVAWATFVKAEKDQPEQLPAIPVKVRML